ncbi:hypothetical protein [Streptomyces cinereoruber]|uniref:hypothetical protein n=1 Tax=Streptomyces cinereoruber TaxID=67260 RepID=UPI0036300F18
MSTPGTGISITHELTPYDWSTKETAAYEAAVEAVNGAVGAYTARIAAERAKASPNQDAIDADTAACRQLAREREELQPDDREQIANARRRYAALARQIREGSA